MKQGIHPNYEKTTIRCACGAEFETRSTKKDIRVEICSKCHPFFTGRQKWWIPAAVLTDSTDVSTEALKRSKSYFRE